MTSQAGSLASDTLHETAITREDYPIASKGGLRFETMGLTIGVVIDQIEALLVVKGSHVSLGDTKTDRVGEALAERTGGDLDTIGMTSLWVTRGQGIELTEVLEVIERQLEAQKVKVDVLEGATTEH